MLKKKEKDPTRKKQMTKVELENALVENFVNLQRVLTNLSIKFEDLSSNISKLLQLFEISAKQFAEKYDSNPEKDQQINKEFLGKIDSLLDQNKAISKGILLMEERIQGRVKSSPDQTAMRPLTRRPLPRY